MAAPDDGWRWRLVDADANRACEGLRALEDAARFVLDEPAAAERLRALRHGVRRLAAPHNDRLLAARDVESDPGGARTTAGPPRRDLEAYLSANAKRAQEALRALEEALGAGSGRLPVYGLERLLVGKARRQSLAARLRGLYAILDPAVHERPLERLTSWLSRGVRVVQLRDKRARGRAARLAREAADACRRAGSLFIVNDDAALAAAAGADGVHLGAEDLPVPDARRLLGPLMLIGRTVRTPVEASQAVADGADYLGVGRLFPSRTKPAAPEVGLDGLRAVRAAVGVPVVGIGGVGAATYADVLAAGAAAAAAISSVDDILAACVPPTAAASA